MIYTDYVDVNFLSRCLYYSTGKKAKLSSLTYELLAEFFFGENEQQSSIAEEVLMYIKRNFTKKLSLEDISKQIGVSVSKICHDFKVKYGCSIFTKIKDLRLNYAKELLLSNSNWHIREVALACGFDDFSYFCRAYKERFNKTPKNSVKY
ncbi:MAG: helix-turn-helix transcriptional regulator [Clostridia bacterium]|nr:helix-turn-helix transcriptional regulator [Clostridia bacterium]